MTTSGARYLGIDAGGSKTAWVVLREGKVISEGHGEPIQLSAVGVRVAVARLQAILASANAQGAIHGVVAGLAGAGNPHARAELRAALQAGGVTLPLRIAGDVHVAAAAALADGPGVALWSGTGSFAVARDLTGELHRVGGRGWLLGDDGSAFDMGRRAAAAVVAAADSLGEATVMTQPMIAAVGGGDALDLGRRLQARPPRDVAALYVVVRAAAERGDRVALAVQRAGAAALSALALAAARHAALPLATLRVISGGGVLQRDDGLRRQVEQAIAAAGVPPALQVCSRPAALGAAELAQAVAERVSPMCRWIPADDS